MAIDVMISSGVMYRRVVGEICRFERHLTDVICDYVIDECKCETELADSNLSADQVYLTG